MPALLAAVATVVGVSAAPAAAPAAAASAHRAAAVAQAASTVSTSSTSLTLTWTNPRVPGFRSTVVRYASGTSAPRTPSSGRLAGRVGRHAHSLRLTRLAAGHHYAFAVFPVLTHHRHGHRLSVVGLVAPAAPTGALPFVAPAGMRITWTNPHTPTFRRVVVRYAAGSAAPSTPTRGHGVALSGSRPSSVVVGHLLTNSRYSVSVFALDRRGGWSTPAVVRFTTPPAAQHAGTYSGTVTDASGHPLAGAVVDASSDSGDERSTTTGPDGAFALPLAAAEWFVNIGGQHITGGAAAVGGYLPDFEDVVIRSGRTTRTHLTLDPGGALTGRFTDRSGHPLAGVVPTLDPVGPYVDPTVDNGGFALFAVEFAGSTAGDPSGPDGTFVLRGVDPTHAYRLCSDATGAVSGGASDVAGYLPTCAARTTVAGLGRVSTVPDLALEAGSGSTVSGTIDGAHHPVPDAFVHLVSDRDPVKLFARSDAAGHYAIHGVPAGSYHVCADSNLVSSHAPTGLGTGCSHQVVVGSAPVVVSVTLPAAAALSGTVRGPGGHRVDGAFVDASGADGDGSGAITRTQGQYTVTGLSPGRYAVCVRPPSTPTALQPTGVLPGCVPGGKVSAIPTTVRTGLDVTLRAGSAVSGTVTDAQGRPADAVVSVEPVDGDVLVGAGALVDAHGRYVVAGLPADTYRVCVEAISLTGGSTRCAPHAVTTRLGHTVGHVDVTLPTETALDVTVTDSNGVPLAGADATALKDCTGDDDECAVEPVFGPTAKVSVEGSFTTDAQGQAQLAGIAPGRYAVCVFGYDATTASGGSPTGYVDTCSGQTFTVTVTAGGTAAVTVPLPLAGAVSGTVTDSGGHPVTGVQATVSHSAATDLDPEGDFFGDESGLDSPLDAGSSGPDGTYTVIGVQPGAQTVCFTTDAATGGSSPTGYRNQCVGAAAGSVRGGTPVPVTAGTTTGGVDIALAPAGAISGRVRRGSTPIADGSADVLVFQGRNLDAEVAEEPTDSHGRFQVTGLEPGGYTLCVDTDQFGGECWHGIAWDDDNDPPLGRATAITVAAGSVVTGIDVDLR